METATGGQGESEVLRVFMIGAGERAKNCFLPVSRLLNDNFEVAAVWSRHFANAQRLGASWGVPAVEKISDVDLGRIDLAIISVLYVGNPNVLAQLLSHAHRLILLIDTPVFSIRQVRHFGLLAKFKRVFVGEDYMNYPEYEIARDYVAKGLLGEVRAVSLMNNGFRYHALAAIRSFFDFARVRQTKAIIADNDNLFIEYRFSGGRRGYVTEPNRRFSGGWTVVGTTGILASHQTCFPAGRSHHKRYVLSPRWADHTGILEGFELTGGDEPQFTPVPQYRALTEIEYEDHSHLNIMRNCGIRRIMLANFENNINLKYSGLDGAYDSIVSCSVARRPMLSPVGTRLALAAVDYLTRTRR
jgi:Oxidoreductase family, NAD-binding Rossmann fold